MLEDELNISEDKKKNIAGKFYTIYLESKQFFMPHKWSSEEWKEFMTLARVVVLGIIIGICIEYKLQLKLW